jgi:hypothetical protein
MLGVKRPKHKSGLHLDRYGVAVFFCHFQKDTVRKFLSVLSKFLQKGHNLPFCETDACFFRFFADEMRKETVGDQTGRENEYRF